MSKLRLCYIITRMIAGGAQKILLDLVRHVDRNSFEIYVISGTETGQEGSLWRELEDLLPAENIFRCPALVRNVNPLKDVLAYFHIKAILKNIRPDIVHTHTSKAGIQGRLAAHALKVPKIIHSTHGLIYSTEAQIPNVSGRRLLVSMFKRMERHVGRMCHHLVTLSERETGEAMALGLAPSGIIRNIPNGIDLSPFTGIQPNEGHWESGHVVLGIAGRLNREKGHEVLLQAMQMLSGKYPLLHLYIAGEGPLMSELKKQAADLGVADKVTFMGYQKDISRFLQKIDIFILASHYEGFGLVLVEAMAAGKPVVATDVGGVREVVQDGKSGLVVPAGSQSDLAMGVEYYLHNPALARACGEHGRQRALANFSVASMLKQHEALYLQDARRPARIEMPEGRVAVDLHMHTCHSHDSKADMDEMFARALEEGVKAIAITDHDTIEGALEAVKRAPARLMVIPGIEITSDVGDIIGLFIDKPITTLNHKEAIAQIRAQGGIVYLPHPFRGRRSISLDLIAMVDVVEVFNGRSQGISQEEDQFGNQDIVNFARSHNKTGVGGSDAHKAPEVARVKTFVPDFASFAELKEILLSRRIFPVQSGGEWVLETVDPAHMRTQA